MSVSNDDLRLFCEEVADKATTLSVAFKNDCRSYALPPHLRNDIFHHLTLAAGLAKGAAAVLESMNDDSDEDSQT